MNIDSGLKKKIISHINISNCELDIFMEYVIYKSKIISTYMKDVYDYTIINLCNEILWSYSIDSNIYKVNNRYFCIFNINNKDFLLDIDFNDDSISFLSKYKYIELSDDIYNKYLNIIGGV